MNKKEKFNIDYENKKNESNIDLVLHTSFSNSKQKAANSCGVGTEGHVIAKT